MKYEMIFGDEGLFDGAPDDAEFVGNNYSELRFYKAKNRIVYFFRDGNWDLSDNDYPGCHPQAMRRIIKEPKRWTVADQKAGRLPEVGCVVMAIGVNEVARIAAINNDSVCSVCVVFEDGGFITLDFSGIAPIETQKEKAARLEDEYLNTIAKHYPEFDIPTARFIYRAQFSGELPPVQAKDGE